MPKTETNLDWDSICKELEQQEWENSIDGAQERLVFVGTVMSLYPSGKYYMPWACSNLDACPNCNGTGKTKTKKHRLLKKWKAARKRCFDLANKFDLKGKLDELQKHGWYRYHRRASAMLHRLEEDMVCSKCNGLGSHEAYADEKFSEALQKEAEERGLFVTAGEGDPCDIFVGESRDPVDVEE